MKSNNNDTCPHCNSVSERHYSTCPTNPSDDTSYEEFDQEYATKLSKQLKDGVPKIEGMTIHTTPSDDTKNLHVDDMVGYVSWDAPSDDSMGLDEILDLVDMWFANVYANSDNEEWMSKSEAKKAIQGLINQAITNQLKALMGEAQNHYTFLGKQQDGHDECVPVSVLEDAINRLEQHG